MMDRGTATMVAATATAATFGAVLPSASAAAREGWTAGELQRATITAGAIGLTGAAGLAVASRSGDPLYVAGAMALVLGLVYQLAAGARRG